MKYMIIAGSILLLAMFGVVSWAIGSQDDIDLHRRCVHCNMDRKAYGFSRMLVIYEDGASVGICSLHCTTVELGLNKGRKVRSLLVADRDTRSLTEADKAVWVIGGNKPGVMTKRAKWAFESSKAAEKFAMTNGGKIVTFTEAMKIAEEEF